MATAEEHATTALRRAARAADLLTDHADLLGRHGINVNRAIARIDTAARSGDPAYAAMDPIINLGDRITRISDRINGTVVCGRTITTCALPDDNPDGDVLAAIGINLVDSIPRDVELYVPPPVSILRQR